MRSLGIVAILMTILLIPGMFGNTQLICTTFKFKELQHRNGLLVGIIAALNVVNILFETANVIEIFMGKSLMERRTCNMTIFMYGFSFNISTIAILFLAIDRLLAVWSPDKYRSIRSSYFIVITFVMGFIYAAPFVIFGFIFADNTLIKPCNPASAYAPMLAKIWSYASVTTAVIVILLNIASYFIMLNTRKNLAQRDAADYHRQMRVTNSLRIMMIVYGMTTVLSSFIYFVVGLLNFSEKIIIEITSYGCLLMLLNYASQYYVLFWRSQNYRKIFLKLLGFGQTSTLSSSAVMIREITTHGPNQRHNSNRDHNRV